MVHKIAVRTLSILLTLLFIFQSDLKGQLFTLTLEDFVNANGTTSGAMSGGQPWVASVPGGCPGPVGTFSVQTQQFNVTLANGFNCVNCTDGSATPPLNCGDNLNPITFGPIDISTRCKIGITTQITATGSLECASPGGPPSGPVGGGHDQVACYYIIDGGPETLYGYMCGNTLIMPAATGNVLSGNSLTIKIYAGNQNPSETYRIDNVVVSYFVTTPTFTQLGPYCVGESPSVLPSTSPEGAAGTWSPATINTAMSGSTIHTFTPSNPLCFNSTTMTVVVNPNTTPNFTAIGPLCKDSNAPLLANVSPNGVNGSWNPAVINTGSIGSTNYVFTPDAGICALQQTLNVTITAPLATNFGPIGPLCQNSTAPVLSNVSPNGVNGSWSPAVINTSTLGSSDYTFTPNIGECALPQTLSITISAPLTPDFAALGPFCQNATAPALGNISPNGINGTWSPGVINTSTVGSSNYVFTPNIGVCALPQTLNITITAPLISNFAAISPLCLNTVGPVLSNVSPNGINGSWSPAVINTSTQGSTNYVFTPTVGQCALGQTINVTINPLPNVTANPAGPLCTVDAPIVLSGNPAGGTWSGPGVTGNSFNPATAGAGNHTITYTYTDANMCTNSTTIQIVVTACGCANPVMVDTGIDQAICAGQTASVSGSVMNGTTYQWSSTGTGTFANFMALNTIYTPSAADIAAGSVMLVLTANDPDGAGPCSGLADFLVLTINQVPTVSLSGNITLCPNECEQFTVTVTGGSGLYNLSLNVDNGTFSSNFNVPGIGINTVFTFCYQGVIPVFNQATKTLYIPIGTPAGSGTVTLLSIVDQNTMCPGIINAPNNLGITLTTAPVVTANSITPLCLSDPAVNLVGNPVGGTWTGPGVVGNTFNPGVAGVGNHQLTYSYTDGNGCSGTAIVFADVNACGCATPVTANAGPDQEVCSGVTVVLAGQVTNSAIHLWSTSGTGIFDNINDLNTNYNPSNADIAAGSVNLTLTVPDPDGAGPCTGTSDIVTIVINLRPTFTFNAGVGICPGSCESFSISATGGTGPYTVDAFISTPVNISLGTQVFTNSVIFNICYSGSVLSFDDATNTINIPSTTPPGQVLFGYMNYKDLTTGCIGIGDLNGNFTAQLLTNPIVTANPVGPLCLNDPAVTLTGNPANGIWSGPGVTGNSFNPSIAGIGNHILTYTVIDANSCEGQVTISVNVSDCNCSTPVSADAGIDQEICSNETATLSGNVINAPSSIWSSSGTGTFGDPSSLNTTYTPSAADISGGQVILTLLGNDPDGAGPCVAVSDQVTITITSINITISSVSDLCDDDPSIVLNATPIGGTWSGDGMSGNIFDPALAGAGTHIISYTYTDANNCSGSDNISINVNDCDCPSPATADAGSNLIVCGNQIILLNGSVSSTANWSTSGTGFFDNPNMAFTMYNASPADIASGSVTLTLTASDPDGAGPCSSFSDQMTVTFETNLNVTANPVADLCSAANPVNLTGSPAGGIWSGTGVTGNSFDPAIAGIGTFILTYFVSNGSCDGSDNISVTVTDLPIVTIPVIPDFCVGDAPLLLNMGTPAGGFYFLNGDFSTAITSFDPNTIGTQTITYVFGTAPCTNQVFTSFEVLDCGCANPTTADAGIDQNDCEGTIFTLAGIITGANVSTWSTTGDGIFGNPATLNTTYTPGPNDILTGSVTITLTTEDPDGAGPCNPATNTMTITINKKPVIAIQNVADLCNDDPIVTLSATPSGGLFTGSGVTGNQFNPALAGIGDHTIYYKVGVASCMSIDSIIITVIDCGCNNIITVNVGPDTTICQISPVYLNSVTTGNTTGTWSTSGSGSFNNISIPNAVYTPSAQDFSTGTVTLTFTTLDPDGAGPCKSAVDQKIITIVPQPEVLLLATQPSCTNPLGTIKITILSGQNLLFSIDNGITFTTDQTINNLSPNDYQLIVKNPGLECQTTLNFTINSLPISEAFWTIKSAACSDDDNNSFILYQTSNLTLPYQITINGDKKPTVSALPATFDMLEYGVYDIVLTDSKGCSVTKEIEFKFSSSVELNVNPIYIIDKGESVVLQTDIVGDYETITWTPGLWLSCDDCPGPTAKPDSSITYTVVVMDSQGCTDEGIIEIRIRKKINVFIPNVISPNHDGINDGFTVYGDDDVKEIKTMKIFNRWGGLVFERSNFELNKEQLGWDGTFKGQDENPNVFVYFVEVVLKDGEVKLYKGDVTVVK